jgi:spore coat protein CotF
MNLTPNIKSAIRDELNYYKMNEMEVHELSMSHTVFH